MPKTLWDAESACLTDSYKVRTSPIVLSIGVFITYELEVLAAYVA